MEENIPQQDLNTNDPKKSNENSTKIEISKNLLINLFIVLFGIVLILFEIIFIRNTDNTFGAIEITITTVTIILFVFLMLLLNNKRMMNLREELIGWWRTILKMLISGPMVSLYLTAAGGFIGYQITSWLNQEDIKIVGVVVKPKPIEINLSNDLKKDLRMILSIDNYKNRFRIVNPEMSQLAEQLGKSSLDEATFFNCYELVVSKRTEIQEKIDLLNQNFSDYDKKQSFVYESFFDVDFFDNNPYKRDYQNKMDKLTPDYLDYEQSNQKDSLIIEKEFESIKTLYSSYHSFTITFIDKILDKLISEAELNVNSQLDRDFQLEVIVTNEGGTQSVLRYKAMLSLDEEGQQKSMMKQTIYSSKSNTPGEIKEQQISTTSNFIIVEPQGFANLQLQMENDNIVNNQDEIDRVKKAYQLESIVWLTLFDINNNPIGKYSFQLRDDMEADPNKKIKKIIKKYRLNNNYSKIQ